MSIKYRMLDADGDYVFGNNAQNFLSDTDAVTQAVKTRLKLFQGEWWENKNEGLPLFQSILGQSGSPENIKSADLLIKDIIANTQDVTDIVSFSSTYVNRNYSFSCTIETKYGSTQITS